MERNARAWFGLVEQHNDAPAYEDGYASGDVGEFQDEDETLGGQLAMGNGIQIAIVRPRNFQDAVTIGEYYRQDIPVIINLEDMDNAEAWRIIDFASGLILGLYGDIERLSKRTFLIMPAGATILTARNGLADEGFYNQALGSRGRSRDGPGGPDARRRAEDAEDEEGSHAAEELPAPGPAPTADRNSS